MKKVTDIVFDVGRVLIDINYNDLFRFLHEHGAEFNTTEEFSKKIDLEPYECGHISSDQFIDNVSKLLATEVDRSELTARWLEIFDPITEMLDFASYLKADFGVFLLSNTNALHWDYLLAEYRLRQVCMGTLASFEVGAMKPEPEIFREAEKRFGLIPEKTILIDDIEVNSAGAMACGWHGIHHTSIGDTKKKMETFLMCALP